MKENRMLIEAQRIADKLISKAEKDEHGIFWKTLTMDSDRNTSYEIGESIYSGNAGVTLFLIELFHQNKEDKYLKAALSSFEWLFDYCKKHDPYSFAFFTGRMSVVYVFLRAYEITGDKKFLNRAATLAEGAEKFLTAGIPIDDIINGISGTLLGLTYLYSYTEDEKYADLIEKYIQKLMARAQISEKGIYWDRTYHQISGLCGFSHGAAGIGFVFNQLGDYFKNKTFHTIADLAFYYENSHFNKAMNNWPDLRRGYYSPNDMTTSKEKLLNGEIDYFLNGGDMNAWCHGAAGIGLARLSAINGNSTKDTAYLNDARKALKKTYITDIASKQSAMSYTLCHGGGGNAEIFLTAYEKLKDKKYYDYAMEIGMKALESFEKYGYFACGYPTASEKEDTSLFMGDAGVGYFMLRLSNPKMTPSMLLPELRVKLKKPVQTKFEFINWKEQDLKKFLLKKYFSRTLEVLKEKELNTFLKDADVKNIYTLFSRFIKTKKEDKKLIDVYKLENERYKFDMKVESASLVFIDQYVKNEKAREVMDNAQFNVQDMSFVFSKYVKLKLTQHNWADPQSEGYGQKSLTPMLLRVGPTGVFEDELTVFGYLVLKDFKEKVKVKDAVNNLMKRFETTNSEEESNLKKSILVQITNAYQGGILVVEN